MAAVLHLLKAGAGALSLAVIAQQIAAGDTVTVALLPDTASPPLPAGVTVRRVTDDLSWDQLVELIFEADQVITW